MKILFYSQHKSILPSLEIWSVKVIDNLAKIDMMNCDILIVDVDLINKDQLEFIKKNMVLKVIGLTNILENYDFLYLFDRIIKMPCPIDYILFVINQLTFVIPFPNICSDISSSYVLSNYKNLSQNELVMMFLIQRLTFYDNNIDWNQYILFINSMYKNVVIHEYFNKMVVWKRQEICLIILILCAIQDPYESLLVQYEDEKINFYITHNNVKINGVYYDILQNLQQQKILKVYTDLYYKGIKYEYLRHL